MTKRIPLTKGYEAIVDDCDYGWANRLKWHALVCPRTVYATRRDRREGSTHLHREVLRRMLGHSEFQDVDHIDGNSLNNTRKNLRPATRSQNLMNRRSFRGGPFKGVSLYRPNGKYRARIVVRGKTHYLGYYRTEFEAALAYDRAARELHGAFARPNFPDAGIDGLAKFICSIAPRGRTERKAA